MPAICASAAGARCDARAAARAMAHPFAFVPPSSQTHNPARDLVCSCLTRRGLTRTASPARSAATMGYAGCVLRDVS